MGITPRRSSVVSYVVDGLSREALVVEAAVMPQAARHPLVFAFHPHGGLGGSGPDSAMKKWAEQSRIHEHWPEAICVYPQGLKRRTSIDLAGEHAGWQAVVDQPGVHNQDIDFFDVMLTAVSQQYAIDSSRVYTTGFSNGAGFSFLLWSQRAAKLAAIGACSEALTILTELTVARPLVAIGGTHDTTIGWGTQHETIRYAQALNHATGSGASCGTICTLYASTIGAPVKTFVHDGGHVYPDWASARIVEFLRDHTL